MPKIFEVDLVSCHQMHVGIYQVNFLEHASLDAKKGAEIQYHRLSIARGHTPQLSLDSPRASNAVLGNTNLLIVCPFWGFVQKQAKRRPEREQILGERLVYRPVCSNELVNSFLNRAFVAEMDSRRSFLEEPNPIRQQ